MSLPIRATLFDIEAICGYLMTKPTGATIAEAKAVVDSKSLDGRKMAGLKRLGLIEDDGNKVKITDRGRECVKQSGSFRSKVLREAVREIYPYMAVIERIVHRHEKTVTSSEVAAHWHDHFKGDVADSDKTLNEQALCFFQVAEGADLGVMVVGRRGMPTRFDFDVDVARGFVEGLIVTEPSVPPQESSTESEDILFPIDSDPRPEHVDGENRLPNNNRVFVTHGKNLKILDQVKELVAYGKFEPVIAVERETSAKPVPQKVMDDMRTCMAAVIHVGAEGLLYDGEGNEIPQINGNVLIEIGAAMALYGDKFVLLVEEGVTLPSNLQGLYECRYGGDELNMTAIMKLLKAFNEF